MCGCTELVRKFLIALSEVGQRQRQIEIETNDILITSKVFFLAGLNITCICFSSNNANYTHLAP